MVQHTVHQNEVWRSIDKDRTPIEWPVDKLTQVTKTPPSERDVRSICIEPYVFDRGRHVFDDVTRSAANVEHAARTCQIKIVAKRTKSGTKETTEPLKCVVKQSGVEESLQLR